MLSEGPASEADLEELLKNPNLTIVMDEKCSSSGLKKLEFEILGYDSKRLFVGKLYQNMRLSVTTNQNFVVMEVGLADNPLITMGKIFGPNRSLMHTVEFEKEEDSINYWDIVRDGESFVKVETHSMAKMVPCLSWLLQCCLCMKGDQEVTYYNADGLTPIGRTAPGICRRERNIILYFQHEATTEERVAMLGTSLLFVLEHLYPEYGRLLRHGE